MCGVRDGSGDGQRWSQTGTGDPTSLDDVLDRAKGIRQMRLDDGDAPSTSSKRRTLPVDFVELKQRYMSVVPTNERVLLDIRERVSEASRASWTSSPRGDDDAGAQVVGVRTSAKTV